MDETRYCLSYIKRMPPFRTENKLIELFGVKLIFKENKNLADWEGELDYKDIIELKRIKNRSKIKALFYRFLLRRKNE